MREREREREGGIMLLHETVHLLSGRGGSLGTLTYHTVASGCIPVSGGRVILGIHCLFV